MGNPIQHVEWMTKDAARVKAFYGAVFDWQFPEWMPGYTGIMTDGKGVGGIMQIPDGPDGEQMQQGIVCYATVDDIGATEERIRGAGGTIMKSNMEVPNVGWFTIFLDPDGNPFAIWKQNPAAQHAPEAPAEQKPAKAAKKAAKAVKKAAKKAVKKAARVVKKTAKKASKAKKAAAPAKKKGKGKKK